MVRCPLQNNTLQYLGLIAERITETFNAPEKDFVDSGIRVKEAPYLGGIKMDEKGIIQRLQIEELFSDPKHTYLLAAGENYASESGTNLEDSGQNNTH
jgi:chemotaxis-related protein WspB